MKAILTTVLMFAVSTAWAQEKIQDLKEQTLQTEISAATPVFAPIVGFRMTMDSGRSRDFSDGRGLQAKAKNELWVGLRHQSGWGTYYNGVVTTSIYRDSSRSGASVGDPSLALIHPTLFDNGRVKQTGYMKVYYPVTDRSRDALIYQYSYYFTTDVKDAVAGFDLLNILTPRYFDDRSRKAENTQYSFEDWSFLSRKANSWIRFGVGHWTQYEVHFGTSPGFASEIFPFVDFALAKKSFVSPRIFFPMISRNKVYDGPQNVTLGEARFDLFVYLSI